MEIIIKNHPCEVRYEAKVSGDVRFRISPKPNPQINRVTTMEDDGAIATLKINGYTGNLDNAASVVEDAAYVSLEPADLAAIGIGEHAFILVLDWLNNTKIAGHGTIVIKDDFS